jgi:chromosome partitioning protein
MGRIIAVANQKGGVGKTTTAINLGASLALANRRVLLVDMDPQANLTSGVGLKGQASPAGSIYHALVAQAADLAAFIIPTAIENLSLVPADRHLTGAEIELVALPEREARLRRLLRPIADRFDYLIIDCPPSLGLLTLNALVAADAILITLHCEYFALEGLAELVSTLRRVRVSLNKDLDIEGVLLTMYDDRTNLGQQVARDIRDFFKEKVFRTVIPRNVPRARPRGPRSHGCADLRPSAAGTGRELTETIRRPGVRRHGAGCRPIDTEARTWQKNDARSARASAP